LFKGGLERPRIRLYAPSIKSELRQKGGDRTKSKRVGIFGRGGRARRRECKIELPRKVLEL